MRAYPFLMDASVVQLKIYLQLILLAKCFTFLQLSKFVKLKQYF